MRFVENQTVITDEETGAYYTIKVLVNRTSPNYAMEQNPSARPGAILEGRGLYWNDIDGSESAWVEGTWTTRDFVGDMPNRQRQSLYYNASRAYTYNFT